MSTLPAWITTINTPIEQRYYFRCHDCLMTVCIALTVKRNDLKCGICNGRLDLLGQVEGNRWIHKAEKCTCNEMCQDARGPKCTCSCGAENHGKGYRYYTYTDASGAINVKADQDTDKLISIATEYRAALHAAVERLHSLPHWSDYCTGKWISDKAAWLRCMTADKEFKAAAAGTMQKSRLAKLDKVAR